MIELLFAGMLAGPATASAGPYDAPESMAPVAATTESDAIKPSPEAPAPAGRQLEFEVGARFFLRGQARANSTYGRQANDEQWQIQQAARVMTAGRYGPVGVVVQLQDVHEWGGAHRP